MKILIVGGANEQWQSLELIYKRYLNMNSVECEIYAIQDHFRDYYYKNYFNKIIFKTGLSYVYQRLNKDLLNFIDTFQPTVIWIFKGMEIFPETLIKIKKLNIFICNYNPDHPFIHSGSGSGNENVRESFPLFDLHFIYGLKFYHECKENFSNLFFNLPFAYDFGSLNSEEIMEQEELFNWACFVGNPDKERALFISQLTQRGIRMDVYGNNWSKFLKESKNLKIYDPVYGINLWRTFRKYRVQLNLLRKHNFSSHNQRTFELQGCGAIQVAPSTIDHEEFFEADKTIFLFNGIKECEEKIQLLCKKNETEAKILRSIVKKECDLNGHTYKSRANYILEILKEFHD